MPQSLHEFAVQLKALLKSLPPAKRITLLTLVCGTIMGFVFLMIWAGRPDFEILYSNLTPEDAGAILTELKDQKIPYRISSNGNSILVPKERIYETRLKLASQGLPQGGGVGFEIFDNTKLGMTEFVQNVNYQRALQGELARTINGFAEVESSRVHIVMPSKSLFIEKEEPATASVILKLRRGRWLTKEQVQGIVHLVSSSVSGLSPENVTIVDNYGNMLAGFKERSTIGQLSSDQLDFQQKVESGLENKIKSILERALGPDKAIVRVSCDLDFKRLEKTEERYDPENKVVRSEQVAKAVSNVPQAAAVGIPGVVSNMSGGQAGSPMIGGSPASQRQDRTVNYEIGKLTSHIIEPVGKIKRVSVAVVVDGTYKPVKVEKEGEEAKESWKYFPRSKEEMKKLENIVKRAVNFDAQRGDQVEVVNIPFETAKLTEAEEKTIIEEGWVSKLRHYLPSARHGFVAMFLFFFFMFVVRPVVRWLTTPTIKEVETFRQLPKTVEEIEREYGEGRKALPFRDRALEMIKRNDEFSVQVMRNWLKE